MGMEEFSAFLKDCRAKRGWSLRDAAEHTGLSHAYIDSLEKGVDRRTGKPLSPTAETLTALAAGYGVSLANLWRLLLDDGPGDAILDLQSEMEENLGIPTGDTLGSRLRRWRYFEGLTLEDVSVETGMEEAVMVAYESDKAVPPPEKLKRLAEFWGVTVDFLLNGSGDPAPPEETRERPLPYKIARGEPQATDAQEKMPIADGPGEMPITDEQGEMWLRGKGLSQEDIEWLKHLTRLRNEGKDKPINE